MAEKIVIASLDLDAKDLIKSATETKKQIDEIKLKQKELATVQQLTGQDMTEAMVKNEAQLKKLSAEYRTQSNVVSQLITTDKELLSTTEALNIAIEKDTKSITEARENIAQLTKIRNELNLKTTEGQNALALINSKIDDNNNFIKENSSQLEKNKINVGNYTNSIKDALANINPLNGGLSGFVARSQEAGGAGNLLKQSLAGASTGFLGLVKSSLAFIATPIGAVLAVLVGAFALIKNALDRSSDATAKLSKITGAFSGVMNALLKALEPVGEFLIDGIVAGFKLAVKSIDAGIKAVSAGLKFLGLEKASAGLDNMRNGFEKSAKAGMNLAMAEKELERVQRESQITQLKYQNQAEKLRQIRDDESKSMQERINANNQLGVVLKQQLQDELKIAQLRLKVANDKLAIEGKTKELLDAQADARREIIDIEERITGQESEQLVNINSLRKEANDKAREYAEQQKARAEKAEQERQKRIDNAIQESQNLIRLLQAETGFKAIELEKQIDNEKKLVDKRLALLEQERKAGKKTKTEYEAEKLEISNEFLKKQAELTIAIAQRQLNEELKANEKSLIDKDKLITDLLVTQEKTRLDSISKLRKDFEELQFTEGLITFSEYQNRLAEIDAEFYQKKLDVETLRKEQEAQAKLLDLENQRALEDLIFQDDLAIQLSRLEQKRLLEVANAEKIGADVTAINKKYELLQVDLKRKSEIAKFEATQNSLRDIGSLLNAFGVKNKNLSIALAFADTYLSAQKAYLSQLAIPSVDAPIRATLAAAKAVAFGIANIANIQKTNTGFAEGGYTGKGGKYEPAGIVHKGEVVFSQADVEALGGSTFVDSMRPTYKGYADGGIVARATSSNLENNFLEVLRNMPTPVVTVEDINTVAKRVDVIEKGANF